ncbi:MAG TPA: EAL domain-containing protein [Gemmatimonadota bacterium]|nr:EAL domain-containing protein [Gemmatimonadota bacterium]
MTRIHGELAFRALFQRMPEPTLVVSGDGRIVAVNDAACALLARSEQDLVGRKASTLFASAAEFERFHQTLASEGTVPGKEVRVRSGEGDRLQCLVSAATASTEGVEGGWVLTIRDVSSHAHRIRKLQHNALHDGLTGLPNRSLFRDRLERAIQRAQRSGADQFAVLFLDLDRFKVVNDSLGHMVGDEFLVLVAAALKSCLREVDTVARMGGDEFAILLDTVDGVEDAVRVAERIAEALETPLNLRGHEVFASASIGVALGEKHYKSPEEVLRDADIAMYRAKSFGPGRYEVFDETMRAEVEELMQTQTDLSRALKEKQLLVHYQPIVTLSSSQLAGFEALLRWQHPRRGLLYPGSFLALAEETGMIGPIGWWLFEEACRQLGEWRRDFPRDPELTMSINVAGSQLREPGAAERIRDILTKSGLGSGRGIMLDVTERAIMGETESLGATLHALKAMGLRLSIDDFGTGYSSLGYLHRYPFDTVKIDRSFIRELGREEGDSGLVWSIAALAHNLGMDVVGEGVETASQLEELRVLRCEYGQGNLFSSAMDGGAASRFLADAASRAGVEPGAEPDHGAADAGEPTRWTARFGARGGGRTGPRSRSRKPGDTGVERS